MRLASAQLEELDYRKLYCAYSPQGRKSKVDPRVMFKVMVYGYQCGIYSSRKLEEACRYRVDFMWLLEDEPVPDHSTWARFRTGRCAEAVEDLFYQYVRKLKEWGATDHSVVFIDGTKLESRAGRYTFCWRKSVEKHLSKLEEKVRKYIGVTSLNALNSYLETRASEASFVHGSGRKKSVPFPVSWTVKMKKKQKETQDILSYHSQAAGCSDKARAKASGGRQPIEECGRTGL